MRSVFSTACTIGLFLCLCFFSMEKVCLLHSTYIVRAQELMKEEWLLNQCQDATFYANMGQHTTLCTEVEAKARVGAAWHALAEVSSSLPVLDVWESVSRASWPILAAAAATFILFPSAVVAYTRAHGQGHVYRDYELRKGCEVDPAAPRYLPFA